MFFNTTIRSAMIGASLLVLGVATAGDARADKNLEQMIDARQGYYQIVLHNAGKLFGMAKGDIDYNAEVAQTAANNLLTLTNLDVGSMWAPGTSKSEMPGKTRALKAIWDTWPAIGEKSGAFRAAVEGVAGSAGGGLDALRSKVGALGASCKGCHDDFRADNF